jgi:hypothetical protein
MVNLASNLKQGGVTSAASGLEHPPRRTVASVQHLEAWATLTASSGAARRIDHCVKTRRQGVHIVLRPLKSLIGPVQPELVSLASTPDQ